MDTFETVSNEYSLVYTQGKISCDRLGSLIVRGTPWDPWTAPWQAFLRLVGEDKYLLYVFGKHCGARLYYL